LRGLSRRTRVAEQPFGGHSGGNEDPRAFRAGAIGILRENDQDSNKYRLAYVGFFAVDLEGSVGLRDFDGALVYQPTDSPIKNVVFDIQIAPKFLHAEFTVLVKKFRDVLRRRVDSLPHGAADEVFGHDPLLGTIR
jgi:hypothetical protein